jgi:hypothetical protein
MPVALLLITKSFAVGGTTRSVPVDNQFGRPYFSSKGYDQLTGLGKRRIIPASLQGVEKMTIQRMCFLHCFHCLGAARAIVSAKSLLQTA